MNFTFLLGSEDLLRLLGLLPLCVGPDSVPLRSFFLIIQFRFVLLFTTVILLLCCCDLLLFASQHQLSVPICFFLYLSFLQSLWRELVSPPSLLEWVSVVTGPVAAVFSPFFPSLVLGGFCGPKAATRLHWWVFVHFPVSRMTAVVILHLTPSVKICSVRLLSLW